MRARLFAGSMAVWLGVSTMLGCNLLRKKTGDDADAGATTATSAPAPSDSTASAAPSASSDKEKSKKDKDKGKSSDSDKGTGASNEVDVRRYDDETEIDHDKLTVKLIVADVLKEAGPTTKQTLVATIKKDTEVTSIAEEKVQGTVFALILFENPSNHGQTLEGWVNKKVFTAPVHDAGIVVRRRACPGGQVAILLQDGDECVLGCSASVACPANLACDGTGIAENVDGTPGADVKFCVAATPPPPPPVDAGTTPPPPVDAGTTTPPHPKGTLPSTKTPFGMPLRCPPNLPYTLEKGPPIICRLQCQVDDDCAGTPGSKCTANLCNP